MEFSRREYAVFITQRDYRQPQFAVAKLIPGALRQSERCLKEAAELLGRLSLGWRGLCRRKLCLHLQRIIIIFERYNSFVSASLFL